MGPTKRVFQAVVILAAAAVLASATILVFLEGTKLNSSQPDTKSLSPQYLKCRGVETKIFLVASSFSYSEANATYTTTDDRVIQKGSPLFVVSVTLRNDYTAESPPPPNESPTAPADGTAYVYFKVRLSNKEGEVSASDVSTSDFSIPAVSGYGIILASGQIARANVFLSTDNKDISAYGIDLISVTDSIPTHAPL